jgi:uncharacterized repeat protein (TIGR03803 family)
MNRMIAVAVVLFACDLPVRAEPIAYLHHFSSELDHGLGPRGGVAVSDGRIFGTTDANASGGTIYSLNLDGSDYTMLHEFPLDGSEGTLGIGKPVVVGNSVYGVTLTGFSPNFGGTLWAIDRDGSNFRLLHEFANGATGANPQDGPRFFGDRLYGTAKTAGPGSFGTLYSINLDGTDFQILHDFSDSTVGKNGKLPLSAPIQLGTRLFGTTLAGGALGGGTVYSVKMDGTDFQIVHSFPTETYPEAGVIAIDGRLYGTMTNGGDFDNHGAVYSLNLDGSDFKLLHSFNGLDGTQPSRELVSDSTRLFGTTFLGGGNTAGVVYSLDLDGTDFRVLNRFGDLASGQIPNALTLYGEMLYGTTEFGGLYEGGTVFALQVPEPTGLTLTVTVLLVGFASHCICAFVKSREENDEQPEIVSHESHSVSIATH